MKYRLGIDLGGSKIEIVALDENGNYAFQKRVPTPKGDYQGTIEAIASLVESAEKEVRAFNLPVGIGTPGAISPVTKLIKNSNSLCLSGKPLDQDLQDFLKRPVRLANDANCFALSEAISGNAQNFESVFGVIIGTGCGGGLVINKQVHSGKNAIAGEWGHNALPWLTDDELEAPICYCGRRNCNELYISATGVTENHKRRTGQDLKSEEIVERSLASDGACLASMDLFLDRLARALSQVVNFFDPDAIVFGGGLSNVDQIYQELPQRLKSYVFSDEFTTPLLKAKFGDSSGVRGAAWLF